MAEKWLLRIAATLALLIAVASYRFLSQPLEVAFELFGEHLLNRRTLFVMHVAAAPIALAIGAFQMMLNIRRNHRVLHKWLGRVYGAAILVGGIGALGISLNAVGGSLAVVGFSTLAVLWLGTTGYAVWLAIQKRFADHRVWMMRSFALTFAAVTLRFQIIGFEIAGVGYEEASVWLAYTCWIPNLLVAEWLIRTRPRIAI